MVKSDKEAGNENLWKAFFIVLGILVSLAISLGSWNSIEVIQLGRELASLSSSRCSAEDCSNIHQSLAGLEAQVSIISKTSNSSQISPRLTSLEVECRLKYQDIERRLQALERK